MGACTTASRDPEKLGEAERARGHMCRLLAYLWYCVGNSWGTNLGLNCLFGTEHNMERRVFSKQQHLWPPISQGRKALSSGVWMGEEGTWSQEVGGKVSPGFSQLFSSLSQQCHQGAQMERGENTVQDGPRTSPKGRWLGTGSGRLILLRWQMRVP